MFSIKDLTIATLLKVTQPTSCHLFLSIPPENIRKPEVFRGYGKRPMAWNGLNMKGNFIWLLLTNESSSYLKAANGFLLGSGVNVLVGVGSTSSDFS